MAGSPAVPFRDWPPSNGMAASRNGVPAPRSAASALLGEALYSRYVISLAGVAVATVLARLLGLRAEPGMFAPFMVPIVAVALAYGIGPALVTIGASLVASYVWLLAPMLALVPDPSGYVRVTLFRLAVFAAASLATVAIAEKHRRALDRLQRSRRQLMAFMSDDGVGLQAVARDGRVVWADSTAIALLGYEPAELVGSHLSRLLADARVATAVVQRIGAGRDVENVRARLRRRDGSTTEVLLNANTLLGDASSPTDGVLLALLPVDLPARAP
jgi:PAS domain S-box-containing protein